MPVDSSWIALVDDNDDTRMLLRYVFKEIGYSVGEFSSAIDFLEALKDSAPRIALVDLRLPGLDGFALPKIVHHDYGIDVPMIAVSAHVLAGVRETVLEAGFAEFIPKPIDLESLVAIVQKHLLTVH
jgi:CheY-like chemotaxis protein